MKVLFLTAEGFDSPNSINHLVSALCEDILRSEHHLHIVCSHKTGTYEDIPTILLKYENLTYDVVPRAQIDKRNFVRRYLDEIRFAFYAYKKWKKQKGSINIVILQSNPASVFHALLLKTFLGVPIILNLYDVFPGHANRIGVINNHIVYTGLRLMQKLLYRLCSRIVAMSEEMKEILVKEKVSESKVVVIPNWYDDKVMHVIPDNENRFIMKYGLKKEFFYVQFAGLLGYVLDSDLLLDVANELRSVPRIRFLLIGDGNRKEEILSQIKARNLMNIDYYPWQPLEIINDVYNACNVGIIPLKDGVIGNGFPSKACQLMALEKVVVNVMEKSRYGDLFPEHKMGITITKRDARNVAETLCELANNPELCEELGRNAKAYSARHFSRTVNTQKFIRLAESLANSLRHKEHYNEWRNGDK